MKLPTYEQQNEWIRAYIVPLFDLNFKAIADNYKQRKRTAIRSDMEKAGVFDSLRAMDERGMTPQEAIFAQMRKGIQDAADRKAWAEYVPRHYAGDSRPVRERFYRELLKSALESVAAYSLPKYRSKSPVPEVSGGFGNLTLGVGN